MNTWEEFACTTLNQFGHVSLIFSAPNLGAYVCAEEKFEFFVNYDELLQQSRNSIMRLFKKTLQMLRFSFLCQWIVGGFSIWTLPGASQLPVDPDC